MFDWFYNSAMRRYIVMMGVLFSHVQVMRRRDDKIELQRVPITYASKERFVEKLRAITSVNSEMPIAKVETILPRMKSGERVIIAAHGNSLRALVKYLDNMSEEEILELNIPTGVPLVYEFDENFKPLKRYYLGDQDEIAAKAAAVANQGKAK